MPRTHLPNITIAAFCFAVAVTLPWTSQAVAQSLGLVIDHFQDVRLDDENRVIPMARLATANMAPAMPPPQSTPEPEQTTAHVSTEIVLKPAP